jgi:hypothetical protein
MSAIIATTARTTMAIPAMIQPVEDVLLTGLVSGDAVGDAAPEELVGPGEDVCVGSGSGDGLGLGSGEDDSEVGVGEAEEDVGVGDGDAIT